MHSSLLYNRFASMASSEDKRSKAQTTFREILNTFSAAAQEKFPGAEAGLRRRDEESEWRVSLARSGEVKRGFMDFDLNVAPPEDGGSESPGAAVDFDGEVFEANGGEIQAETVDLNARWDALLEAVKNAKRVYEEGKTESRKRRRSRDGGGESRRRIWNGAAEFMAAAPLVVARSTRARAVAMPTKFRDSVLHAAAALPEARFSRHNVKRKFR